MMCGGLCRPIARFTLRGCLRAQDVLGDSAQPPWRAHTLLALVDKHWTAVFRDVLPRAAHDAVKVRAAQGTAARGRGRI